MSRYEAWRHEGVVKAGFALLGVGVVLLLAWLVASKDGDEPRCGGERMSSGDYCSSRKAGPSSYEEMKANAGTAAFWLSRVGVIFTLGGAGLLIGERTTRGLRAGLDRRRFEAEDAKPISVDELVRVIRTTDLPLVRDVGYAPRAVDAVLDQIVTSLEKGEPAAAKQVASSTFPGYEKLAMLVPGYDMLSVDSLMMKVERLLRRPVVDSQGRKLSA